MRLVVSFALAVALVAAPAVAGAQVAGEAPENEGAGPTEGVGPSAADAEAPAATPQLWPWSFVALGGAMVVASVVTGSLALVRQSELDAACAPHSCPPSLEASQLEGRMLAFSTDALWAGGLVVAALGLVLVVALPPETGIDASAVLACDGAGCAVVVGGAF